MVRADKEWRDLGSRIAGAIVTLGASTVLIGVLIGAPSVIAAYGVGKFIAAVCFVAVGICLGVVGWRGTFAQWMKRLDESTKGSESDKRE